MNRHNFTVQENEDRQRLDKLLASSLPDLTRSALQKLIEGGCVFVNGKPAPKSLKVKTGDEICVSVPDPEPLQVAAQDIALSVIYEDGDLLVVNKPKGMVVHPAPGNPDKTLVNALLHHCGESLSGINGVVRPGIVHRIDKDTSGLLLVAKNDFAHKSLAAQIKEHSFTREYFAVLCGNLKNDSGTVDAPLGRSPKDRKKQAVRGLNARSAVTRYACVRRYKRFCLVECTLETGRTHQIRVHMAYLGHPVAGDRVYGGAKNDFSLEGQCLHAAKVGFMHPRSGEYMEFCAPLPEYFEGFLKKIEKESI
ncbi:MAG: RluA family pseudouridine synthase [Oscillospiraceae bacterium]|jgi:23S rRNA pseudouridine1911/1915/1917 synthase|nr:RluA family pseudouridine synthase [Oscillospiraceae bacterium]